MKFVQLSARPDWQGRVEAQGFDFHSIDDKPYWVDDHAYEFTTPEVQAIEEATLELQKLCIDAVKHVIEKKRFKELAISDASIPLILDSWYSDDPTLYGRFDLRFDGTLPPKMLEYNADTPTALLESSLVQWQWLEDQKQHLPPQVDQFNFLHEAFVEAWTWYRKFAQKREDEVIYFSCVEDSIEDLGTINYLRACASQAGLATGFIHMTDIGWNGSQFVDLNEQPILHLFKLYPWEMMMTEQFHAHLLERPMKILEPAWKMILSNKGILPILWELYEGHPNLLASYFDPKPLGPNYVKKPIFSREGANITIVRDGDVTATQGVYGAQGHIYQEFSPLPAFGDRYAMIGSWVVGSSAPGMCIREARQLITDNLSCFVPHYFLKQEPASSPTSALNRFKKMLSRG